MNVKSSAGVKVTLNLKMCWFFFFNIVFNVTDFSFAFQGVTHKGWYNFDPFSILSFLNLNIYNEF